MQLKDQTKGYLMVATCSALWGSMFLYAQYLLDHGLQSKDIVSWKMLIGFIIMILYTFCKDKNLLKIDKRGMAFAALMGLICHAVQNLLIFSAIERTTIATAVALLYTAPVFVMIMSRLLFKEPFTSLKIIALVVCMVGVFLTVTGGSMDALGFDSLGILFGLGAGLSYGLMNMLSKALLNNYKQITILTYTFGFAFLFSLTFSNPMMAINMEFDIFIWMNILLLGTVPTALSYMLFTTGLSYGIESSKAAIICTLEVVVSVMGSYIFYGQNIMGWKLVGIFMILTSMVLLQGNIIPSDKAKEPCVKSTD